MPVGWFFCYLTNLYELKTIYLRMIVHMGYIWEE
jgi:hypothetical protein